MDLIKEFLNKPEKITAKEAMFMKNELKVEL
jgi:hypothetical protein